jgi:hypothetical protein
MGGLGILDMDKFARALRLRWPWLVWKDAERAWVDLGHPCDEEDMALFYECTSITVGNGQRASFWHSPWLGGRKPKDIAPSIFAISKHKNDTIHRALDLNKWIANINTNSGLTIQHILEYYELWVGLQEVFLDEGVDDEIVWKLSPSGEYTASSAYKAQLDDSTASKMKPAVWNNWAPPKHKFFAWLIIQDRVWTADRLERRGWPNCGLCQLCKREPETAAHIIFRCRYTLRIWTEIKTWMGLTGVDITDWSSFDNVNDWWHHLVGVNGNVRKGLASLVMLVSWEIWNERNARVFRKVSSMPNVITSRIKAEVRLWGLAGAKRLSSLMPRE